MTECAITDFLLYYGLPLLLVLWAASSWWSNRNLAPGPLNLPILGYLPFLNQKAPHETLFKLSKRYGSIYGIHMGSVYTVVLTDHKLIRQAFAKEALTGRAPLYVTHGIMKGYGLICAEGELWKDQRKFVVGFLKNFGIVKYGSKRDKIESLIKNEVSQLVKCLSELEKPEDPLPYLRHFLGSAVNLLVFGKTWSIDDPIWKWLQELQEEGVKHIGVAGPLNFLPFLRYIPTLTKNMKFLIEGKIETHKLYQKLIQKVASKSNFSVTETTTKQDDSSPSENVPEFDNLIEAFLYERKRKESNHNGNLKHYSDEQFNHLLADVFGAGLDTTLTTLRWFLLFLAASPEEQRIVQEELDSVLQGKQPELEHMIELPLTEAAICEAQRIRSVVPLGIPHGAVEDFEFCGYRIPKGTMVVPLQWGVHMDAKNWKNPETFDPSRFIDCEGRLIKPDYFIPYQTGKRMCVGDQLARMLLFLFGTTILQNFSISLEDESKLDTTGDCGITLTPQEHRLVFRKRNL